MTKLKRLCFLSFMMIVLSGFAGTTRYVSPDGPHTPPFNEWNLAATNIQSAVDLCIDGDTVMISNGVYYLSSEITVTNAITLFGNNDPSLTVINGSHTVRCLNLSDVACVISGLTITNGFASNDGGGVFCYGPSPVVTNCVITGCSANAGGGMAGGRLYGSVVENNEASYEGGGLFESIAYHSTIISNSAMEYAGGGISAGKAYGCYLLTNYSVQYSGGMEDGVASNCLFQGNECVETGGGASFSEIYNCTVVGNSAGDEGGGLDLCDSYNSIVYSNTAITGAENISNEGSIMHCCSPDAPNGVDGNIDRAPVFMNPSVGNYRLQIGSPCINAGSNAYVSSAKDLDGNVRIVGGTVDMGSYEFQTGVSDTDGDGMDDQWEIDYFGSTNASPTSYAEDSDIFNNLDEYIAGTDPTNALSYFMIAGSKPDVASGGFIIQWASVSNRVYGVSATNSLFETFQTLETGIEHPRNSYTDTVHGAESTGFYRLDVQLKE